jgi:hypothetical protein
LSLNKSVQGRWQFVCKCHFFGLEPKEYDSLLEILKGLHTTGY